MADEKKTTTPDWLNKIVDGVNSVTSKIKLGQFEATVDKNTILYVGLILIAVVTIFSVGRKRRR